MCSGDEAEEGEGFLDQEEEDRAATIALMGRATSDIAAAPASAVTPLQVSLCFVKQKITANVTHRDRAANGIKFELGIKVELRPQLGSNCLSFLI
jgi:hypothetical protein